MGGERQPATAPPPSPAPPSPAAAQEQARLVEGCRRGDFACFERLMARYEKKIYNLALRMLYPERSTCVGNEADAVWIFSGSRFGPLSTLSA